MCSVTKGQPKPAQAQAVQALLTKFKFHSESEQFGKARPQSPRSENSW
jgi:hypothetical protein